jgi:hypothetical protein
VQLHHVEPEVNDPLHEPPQGRLVRQLGTKGCRVLAVNQRAVGWVSGGVGCGSSADLRTGCFVNRASMLPLVIAAV